MFTHVLKRHLMLVTVACAVALSAVLGANRQLARAQAANQVTVAVFSLPLYSQPSEDSKILETLHKGDVITINARDLSGSWLHGSVSDGTLGWVEVAYVLLPDGFSFPKVPVPRTPGASNGGGNPPPISGGGTGRGFALGGQATSLGSTPVNAMRSAGMTWVKFQYQSGDGGALGQIDSAHAQGFHILLSVIGNKGSVTDDGYQNSYASYVAGLAAHGADGIEIWNEQNLDREWPAGQINPSIYVHLLAKAYNAIKAVHPSTLVISGAPSPTGAEGAFGLDHVWNDDHYYAGMAAAGAGSYADCIGAHYNEGVVSPNQSSGDPRSDYPTRYFGAMLSRAGNSFGLPVCFTEIGYLSPEGYGPLPGNFGWAQNTTVAQQAQWLAQAASRAANSGRVRLMIVFNVDFSSYGADPQAGYAMIRPGGGCPACGALGAVMGH